MLRFQEGIPLRNFFVFFNSIHINISKIFDAFFKFGNSSSEFFLRNHFFRKNPLFQCFIKCEFIFLPHIIAELIAVFFAFFG